jgi:hypothetical protein
MMEIRTLGVFILIIAIVWLGIIGCRKEPRTPVNENELITTLKITFTDSADPGQIYTFQFQDLDGEGGAPASVDSVFLPKGVVFNAELLLLDERNYPPDTTNIEIEEENTLHQFFYQSFPEMISGFVYKNFDDDGMPLGLQFRCQTPGNAGAGTLRIILIHEGNKDGTGVSNNDATNAGGSTDMQVDFPVRIF